MSQLDLNSYFYGVFTGLVLAGLYGVVTRRILRNWAGSREPDRRQRVNHETGLTPREVMREAARAFARFMAWSIVGVGLLLIVVWLFYMLITQWAI